MPRKGELTRIGGVLVIALASAACRGADEAPSAEDGGDGLPKGAAGLEREMAQLRAEIAILIGEARCTAPTDCGVAAMGAKPCGGPAFYEAYSVRGTDVTTLMAKVDRYGSLNRQFNQLAGVVSDCAVVAEPGVDCVAQVCALQSN